MDGFELSEVASDSLSAALESEGWSADGSVSTSAVEAPMPSEAMTGGVGVWDGRLGCVMFSSVVAIGD